MSERALIGWNLEGELQLSNHRRKLLTSSVRLSKAACKHPSQLTVELNSFIERHKYIYMLYMYTDLHIFLNNNQNIPLQILYFYLNSIHNKLFIISFIKKKSWYPVFHRLNIYSSTSRMIRMRRSAVRTLFSGPPLLLTKLCCLPHLTVTRKLGDIWLAKLF